MKARRSALQTKIEQVTGMFGRCVGGPRSDRLLAVRLGKFSPVRCRLYVDKACPPDSIATLRGTYEPMLIAGQPVADESGHILYRWTGWSKIVRANA